MRTSPRALLVAGAVFSLLALLATLPWPAQATGALALPSFPPLKRALLPLPGPHDPQAQHLLEVVNRTRWENGMLPPLRWNAALELAALAHSQSMAQQDFFGHKGADLSSPWDRIDAVGYGNWYVLAENIAAGYQSAEDVVQAWLQSPQHRENLLNPELCEAGIGYVFEAGDLYPGTTWGYERYWTLDMGSRWDAYPLVIAKEAFSTTSRSVPLYVYGAGWATEMRLSNDGINWSAWMPYQPTLTWELAPGNGEAKVYGQLRDAQGNVMSAEDDIVLVEAQKPTVRPAQAPFLLQQGLSTGRPLRYRVQIADPGGGGRNWYASWDQNWLRLRTGGEGMPTGIYLVLTNQAGLLAPGIYTATVTLTSGDAQVNLPTRLLVVPKIWSAFLPLLRK
jgi:uncharacterized protein YkwD